MHSSIDALFAGWNRGDSPGAVLAVRRHGQVVHEAAYGMASLAHGVPLDHRSVIRIGSQTKQFCVLLALILEQAGKLSMGDEVHRFAPWLGHLPHRVTLEHLARNVSGIRDFLEILTWSGSPLAAPVSRGTIRGLIGRHAEMNFAPGTAMIYCNTGFLILSEIIEEVSGRSFNELLAGHLTGRLGMDSTCLVPRDTQVLPRLVDMHISQGASWETARWGVPLGGEGGMVSTLEDMVRWQAMLEAPPADLAPLLRRMEQPVAYANGAMASYAMGLVRTPYRGMTTIGHGGGVAGGKSESIRFVEPGLGVVLLANLDGIAPHPLARRIADIALADTLGPRPALPDLSAHEGLWREVDGDDVLAIGPGPCVITSGGPVSLDLVGPGEMALERPTQDLRLQVPQGGLMGAVSSGRACTYRRMGPAPVMGLAALAGDYANLPLGISARIDPQGDMVLRSDVGGQRLRLAWADDDMLFVLPPGGPGPMRPFIATLRVVDGGLVLTSDRTRGLGLRRVG